MSNMSDRKKRVKRYLKPPPLSVRNAGLNQDQDNAQQVEASRKKENPTNSANGKPRNAKPKPNAAHPNQKSQDQDPNEKKSINVKRIVITNAAETRRSENETFHPLSEHETDQIIQKLEELSVSTRLKIEKLKAAQANAANKSGSQNSSKSDNLHQAKNASFAEDSTPSKLGHAAADTCLKPDRKCESSKSSSSMDLTDIECDSAKQKIPQKSPESGKKGRKLPRSEGKNAEKLSATGDKSSHAGEKDQYKSKCPRPEPHPGCASQKTFGSDQPFSDQLNSTADDRAYKSPRPKCELPKRNATRPAHSANYQTERNEMPPPYYDEPSRVPPLHYERSSRVPPLHFNEVEFGPDMELDFEGAQIIFCMDSEDERIVPINVTSDIDAAAIALARSSLPPTTAYNYLGRTPGEKSPEMPIWARADKYRGDLNMRSCNRHETEVAVSSSQTQTVPQVVNHGNQADIHSSADKARQIESNPPIDSDGGGDHPRTPGKKCYVDPVENDYERRLSREIVRIALNQMNTTFAFPENVPRDNDQPEQDPVPIRRNRRVKRKFGRRCPCKDVANTNPTYNREKSDAKLLVDALAKARESTYRWMAKLANVDSNRCMIAAQQLQLKSLEETEKMNDYAERMISRMEAELGITDSGDDVDAQSCCTVDLEEELRELDDISISSMFTWPARNDEEFPIEMTLYEAELIRAYRERKGIVVVYDPEKFFAIKTETQDDAANCSATNERENKSDENSSNKNRGKNTSNEDI